MIQVKRALISVSDKKGIVSFARALGDLGVEILSTGGTARQLKDAGISVQEVADYTGFPEMLDGRVKTLHPKIHGGLLAVRENQQHMLNAKEHGIRMIDMLVVNLYPFEQVVKRKNVSFAQAIENIDIGGPAMLRSAAKNFKNVAVLCNPNRYSEIMTELRKNHGLLPDSILLRLALEAFDHTARYDHLIFSFLQKSFHAERLSRLPQEITLKFHKIQDLRYGENPHQQAAFYREEDLSGLAGMKKKHGKELSFNNILDLNAAVDFVKDMRDPAAVIIKHNNPTGVAEAENLAKAYYQAWTCDKVSAFGGIIGLNRHVDEVTAQKIAQSGFMECVIAPGFSRPAFQILSQKKNLRLLTIDFRQIKSKGFDFKKVHGGLLLQDKDEYSLTTEALNIVTKKKPTKAQTESMLFGWKVVKHIKSNAIVLVKGKKTVGIGGGQTSRVQSVKIAIERAGGRAKGSVLVSDAFIPHIDNVQWAAKAGVKAIIQTGGSVADKDVIAEANKYNITMVTTGVRHFKH